MSIIGEQIKKFRIENKITQEQLGELVGVTTQGVSRWERGGTPDAELLPKIAEVLGVSIDSLFGQEEQSLTILLARHLSRMDREEAYRYAADICWAMEVGLLGDMSVKDDFLTKLLDQNAFAGERDNNYLSRVISDSGMAFMRTSPSLSSFVFIRESGKGISKQLCDPETIRKVFAVFADEKMMKIIFYLYSAEIMPISVSLISKKTGISHKEAERCMEILCDNLLAERFVVATADGDLVSYGIRKESFAIPLLCFADEIAQKNTHPIFGEFRRTKPLL